MKLAVDFGSSTLRAARCGDNQIVRMPSLATRDPNSLKLLALGDEVPGGPGGRLLRPVRAGRILDWEAAVQLLKRAIAPLRGRAKPSLWMCVPAQLNLMQRRIWRELGQEAGASQVELVESPICCAAGSGCEVSRPLTRCVLDWGAGSLDLGLLAAGEILQGLSLPLGGLDLDLSLQSWLRQNKGLLVSLEQAEEVKTRLLSALYPPDGVPLVMEVSGLGAVDARPTRIELNQSELRPAIESFLLQIREAVLQLLASASPESASDLLEEGLWLCGGSSPMRGLATFLEQITSLPVLRVEAPQEAALRGLCQLAKT